MSSTNPYFSGETATPCVRRIPINCILDAQFDFPSQHQLSIRVRFCAQTSLYISQRITGAQIFPLLTQRSIVGRNAAAAAECVVGGDVMGISSKAASPPNSHAMTSLSSYSARSEMYTHRNYITLTAGATVMSLCSHHNQYVQALLYTLKSSPPLFWYVRGWCFGPT